MTAPAVLGVLLMVVGAAALLFRTVGADLFESVAEWGWPLFIVVPGLVLLAASLFPTRPNGIGFAIAGSIVTAVGLLLLYQWQSDHWESWAYAWALIPGAAGVGQILYGAFAREGAMVGRGLWMAGISALLFVAGAWFFEGVFAGDLRPRAMDLWPIALIALGGVIVVRAFVLPGGAGRADGRGAERPPPAPPSAIPPAGEA